MVVRYLYVRRHDFRPCSSFRVIREGDELFFSFLRSLFHLDLDNDE